MVRLSKLLVWTAAGTATISSNLLGYYREDSYPTDLDLITGILLGAATGLLVAYFKTHLANRRQKNAEQSEGL